MNAVDGEIVNGPGLSIERARVLASVAETVRVALLPFANAEQRQDALVGLNYLAQLVYGSTPPPPPTTPGRGDVIARIAEIVDRHARAWEERRRTAAGQPSAPSPQG